MAGERIPAILPVPAAQPDVGAARPNAAAVVVQLHCALAPRSPASAGAPAIERQSPATGAPPPPAERPAMAPSADPAALCVDQAALRRISWYEPNAAALAASWRLLVDRHWRDEWDGERGRDDAPRNAFVPPAADRWSVPVYAWGGQQMLLRVVQGEADEDSKAPRRRAPRPALRVELTLPGGWGRVTLLLHWGAGGIALTLAVERQAALRPVHALLPRLAEAMARAELRLSRCQLLHGLPGEAVPPAAGSQPPPLGAGLLRAAAETVVVLLACPAAFSLASR